jgi:hypothetical protein
MATGKADMPSIDLEQAKKLAEQLTPEDRAHLFEHLTELPDSLTKRIEFPPSKPLPAKLDGPQYTLQGGFEREGGTLIYSLDGVEVFRSTFDADSYANVFFEKLKSDDKFLDTWLSDEQRQRIHGIVLEVRGGEEVIGEDGKPLNDEQLKELYSKILREFARREIKGSLEQAARRMSDNFPHAIAEIFKKLTQATHFAGANILRERLGVPEQKYSAQEIRTVLFQQERESWERYKRIVGATSGGAHNVKHKWTPDQRSCLAHTYAKLLPIWTEAKRIARQAQKAREPTRSQEWRKEVLRAYPDLPGDLLETFVTLRGGAKPSDNAAIHAGRECGIPVEYSPRQLRDVIKAWKLKTKS